jgi:hypothetical protein
MKNQTGDPRFLDQVSKCISHRRAITGLDAPLQMADVTPVPEETPEQRKARLAEIFQAAAVAYEKGSPPRRLSAPETDGSG